jgi:hypothetical protein
MAERVCLSSLLEHPLANYLKKLPKLDSAKRPRNYFYSMAIALIDIDQLNKQKV